MNDYLNRLLKRLTIISTLPHYLIGKSILGAVTLLLSASLVSLVVVDDVVAGEVVVRQSTDPKFDAFAVRDQVLKDHQWQEALRQQQQLNILQSLPLGCLAIMSPYRYYSCAGAFYRPLAQDNQTLYIQIDPPESHP